MTQAPRRARDRTRPAAVRRGGPALLFALVVLALPTLVAAAQSWSVGTSVVTVEAGVPTDVEVTVTNTSSNDGGGESIGCVRITIPPEFAVGSAAVTSVTNGLVWSVSTSSSGSTIVEATAADDGERLRGDPDFDILVLTLSVTGGAQGSHFWVADEYEKPDCSQNHDQPVSLPMAIGTGANDAPVAGDDSFAVLHHRTLSVGAPGVLGNDSDLDSDPLTAVLDTMTSNGTVTLAPDGSFDYTPDPGFVGNDSFTYHADDGTAASGSATVTIDVTDSAPIANDDAYSVDKNGSLSVGAGSGVLADDTDADPGETLTASVVTDPTNGSLILAADGSFDYTPDPGFSGTDVFTYRVSDGALSSTATVTITVVKHVPLPVDDLYSGAKNVPLIVNAASGVLANDSDPDGDPLTASVTSGPSFGVLLLAPNGGFTYTPLTGFDGTDQFTYAASDGQDSATAIVTLGIANSAPVASDDAGNVSHDRALVVAAPGVLGNDSDANGDALTASVVSGPSMGTLTLDTNGGYTYAPDPGFVGTDTFTYRADDGAASSGIATVTVNVTNVSPTASDDGYSGAKAQPLVVDAASGVLANDADPDGDALVASVTTAPSNGTLALASDGSFTYTPSAGFIGTDTFGYSASDGLSSAAAAVSITISNVAPVSSDDSYTMFRNQTLTIAAAGVLADDTDADGDALTAILLVGPTNGVLSLGAGGGFTYTPAPGYVGPDAFAYRATDGTDSSGPATVQIDVQNRKPVTADDSATVTVDRAVARPAPGLLANDTDPEGDTLVALLGTGATHGSAIVHPDGRWSYVPDPDFSGSDSFTYVAFDGLLTSAPGTVHLTVRPPDPVETPTPAPTLEPTAEPTPAVAPVPTDAPPTASPSVSPTASAPPSPSVTPAPQPTSSPVPAVPPSVPPAGEEAFSIPDPAGGGTTGTDGIALAATALSGLGSILWAVPSLILSVPGLLLVLAILGQAAGGLAWLPFVRRRVGAFGLRPRGVSVPIRP